MKRIQYAPHHNDYIQRELKAVIHRYKGNFGNEHVRGMIRAEFLTFCQRLQEQGIIPKTTEVQSLDFLMEDETISIIESLK